MTPEARMGGFFCKENEYLEEMKTATVGVVILWNQVLCISVFGELNM